MLFVIFFKLFLLFVYYFYYRFIRILGYWNRRKVASPKADYIFGHFKSFVLKQKSFGVITKELYESYPNEKIVGVYQMATPFLMIRDLDLIKHVMIKDFDCFTDRGIELDKNGLGLNLFHTDGDTWRILRNRFTPLFTTGKLKNMMYLLLERGDKIVEYVKRKSKLKKTNELEVHLIMQKYTMSSISACAFGLDIDMDSKQYEQLEAIDKMIFTNTFATFLYMLLPNVFKFFKVDMFPRAVTEFFFKLVKDIISKRSGERNTRHDFMDLLLEMRKIGNIKGTNDKELQLEMTDTVLAAQAFVFFAAGYETTATTLTYLLYELAMNPDVQDRLIDEIDQALIKNNNELTYDVLKDMKYLDMVFDETLRMHPVVEPLLRRSCTKYKLPGTGLTIDKGQSIMISALGIHFDEKYYPDPLKFDPERFTTENVNKRHSCAYLPFGLGPRNCIGLLFAKAESRVCIVKLLSKFRVQPNEATPSSLVYDPVRRVLYPREGIYINFVSRF